VGWGFSIQNDSPTNWIEITSSQFCVGSFSVTPVVACPDLPVTGTYFDVIALNDAIIGPGATLTQAVDLVGFTSGLGYFVVGTSGSDVGQIVVTFDVYDGDPNSGGLQIFPSPTPLTADASVTVDGVLVPEPATAGSAALAMLLMMGLVVIRRRIAREHR
jgi:hypothetical protein